MPTKSESSIWANSSKKKGYSQSQGHYGYNKGDRYFYLKSLSTGKNREYSSPLKAAEDGWYIVVPGRTR